MVDKKTKKNSKNHRLLAVRSPKYATLPFLFMVLLLLTVFAFLFATAQSLGLLFTFWVLFLVMFGGLYIVAIIKKEKIGLYPTIVAYLLSAVLLYAIVPMIFGIGQSCTGLFGVQASCVDVHFLTVVFLLFNPVFAVILSTLCLSGAVSLIITLRK